MIAEPGYGADADRRDLFAELQSRDFVTPDDVKALAGPVLEHRIILRPEFEIEGLSPGEAVQKIIDKVAVPV